jgi:uncharacterized protein (TIGR01777 family)
MRVLIAGGSGLIGRALTRHLTAGGHEVLVLSRSPEKVLGLPEGARAVGWDGHSAEGWGALVEGAGAVVNLAGDNLGEGRWTPEKKERILESRLQSTAAVVEAILAAENPPSVLLQGSAVGLYGDSGDRRLDESAAPADDFLARVVKAWEAESAPVEERGVRRIIARTGVVLDDDEGALPELAKPVRLFIGGPVGGGGQWVPWIHREDEAAALAFLLELEGAEGAYNVCAPEPVTNAALTQAVGRVLGRPTLMPVPSFAIGLLLGEKSQIVLDSLRAVPERLLAAGWQPRFTDVESAVRDLLG